MLTPARIVKLLCLFFLVSEFAVRASGLTDFPLYNVDSEIGYLPAPNQQGSFLHKHSWAYNDRSMGVASAWNPAGHTNILLIGNSIVSGGNPFDQKEKLGPLIQETIGDTYALWPISAGGWTNINEIVYLNRNPDVAKSAQFFVWEFMSGGLSRLSPWSGDYFFPRERPLIASWYVARRYLWQPVFQARFSDLPPTGAPDPNNLKAFESSVGMLSGATKSEHPGILFLYPKKAEYLAAMQGQEWLPERAEIERIARANHLEVIDIAKRPEWNANLYRADGVHPLVQGNVVLAKILSSAITSTLPH